MWSRWRSIPWRQSPFGQQVENKLLVTSDHSVHRQEEINVIFFTLVDDDDETTRFLMNKLCNVFFSFVKIKISCVHRKPPSSLFRVTTTTNCLATEFTEYAPSQDERDGLMQADLTCTYGDAERTTMTIAKVKLLQFWLFVLSRPVQSVLQVSVSIWEKSNNLRPSDP